MEKGELLYEGKAKKIFRTNDDQLFYVSYKDSATAFNGEKKATISGKGRLNNEISSLLFSKLKEAGVNNHFEKRLSETDQLVRKVSIVPLEVVVRNVIAGSLAKRIGLEEGTALEQPIVEFYYKNDDLGDPLITEDHIAVLKAADPGQIKEMKQAALKVNEVLISHFTDCGIRLIDFKLEFGLTEEGTLLLADEISPDTCRLWDEKTNQKFDKDVFRRDLGSLTEAYEEILTRLGGNDACTK
ncbi:phosphoribosylaminoimidazolesuccinocarboxamide synthase [Metabacillus arenae]|uniref:Phosphoribosylaminoimidazole-succinocarboxamide synthase n=1 Tax=Metabacillus arenae TaxID=2771434 RepID=A0A926NQW4_9BACI|nr:phosphoribosylaminoimidazolesuccinocarboxamide synthase [Metabacillus arenae]MBD1382362.1 phosphoribosylaminoimidazolesuccinocarboxamide synthase [Metabacillus arenae]